MRKGKKRKEFIIHLSLYSGEANAGYNTEKYACTFAKMIQYWRQTWNQRTNGISDIQFPFGFVQVSFAFILYKVDFCIYR